MTTNQKIVVTTIGLSAMVAIFIGILSEDITRLNTPLYSVIKYNKYNYANIKRLAVYIQLQIAAPVTEEQIKKIAIREYTREGFRWDEFTVFIYKQGTDLKASADYRVLFKNGKIVEIDGLNN